MSERTIAFILFPGVTLLDLVGPLQVLKNLPAPYRTVVVGAHRDAMMSDSGVALHAQATFDEILDPAIVLVPGGPGTLAAMADPLLDTYLRQVAPHAELITSVCTGSLILASAGLLDGRRATTHWAYATELEKLGATYVRERWVEDGNRITAAGVSAGIDFGLALVERLAGIEVAKRIQLGIEYDPQPPFGGIDWTQVGDPEHQRQRMGGTGAQLPNVGEIFAKRPDLLAKLS